MSKIEELLKNEKVEWKKLGDVCEFINGYAFKSSLFKNQGFPIVRITNINSGEICFENLKFFDLKDYPDLNTYKIYPNDIVVAMSGATTGKVGYNYSDKTAYMNQRVGKFVPNKKVLNNRFLFHFLLSKETLIYSLASGTGSQPNLSKSDIEKMEIPVPSIETQEKIVEILDNFTNYVTELQARTKQYEYYRDMLLSEEYLEMLLTKPEFGVEGIYKTEWKTLGEIGSFQNGTGMPKSLFIEDDGIGAIHYGHIYTKYNLLVDKPIVNVSEQKASNLKKVYPGDLVIAKTSENIEDVMKTVAYVDRDNAVTGGHAAIFRHNENPKYLSYVFNGASYLLRQKNKLARGVKVIELSITDMEKIKIPVPTVKIQEHIVSILDKFYTLLHNSTDGLQKEIELRQKQYEYYREKLLDFKK